MSSLIVFFVGFLLLATTITVNSATAPLTLNIADAQQIWSSTFGGIRSGTTTSSIIGGAIDPNDATIVLAGHATGTFLGHAPLGDYDAFLIKMTSDGSLVWIRWFATPAFEELVAVAIDLNGNIFTTGQSSGVLADFPTPIGYDVFVVMLNANGDQIWIRQLRTNSNDYSSDIGVDVSGNCYVAWLNGNLISMSKFHSNGTRLFTQTYTNPSYTVYWSPLTDGQRGLAVINPIVNVTTEVSIVLAFTTTSPLTYVYDSFTNAGSYDIIVARVSATTGVPIWSRVYQTVTDDLMSGIKADSGGSIYLAGTTRSGIEGATYTGSSNQNIFLSKLSFDGRKLWTVQYGASTQNVYALNLVTDNAGGVYVVGVNEQNTPNVPMIHGLPPLYGQYSLYNTNPGILSKFDSDGFLLWSAPFSPYLPARFTGYVPSVTSRVLLFDSINGQMYVGGYKNGLYSGDIDATPRFADSEIIATQAFVFGVAQPPSNVTLAQWDNLLQQLSNLVNTA